ncbi:pimeloyl-ACP methyl ester carboxylesterase [Rhizobium laguerreae]
MPDMDAGGFQERFYTSSDGLRLYARDYRPDQAAAAGRLPVICLPGLTRNTRDFHPLALLLSRDTTMPRRVIALDSRGRGNSAWDENKANYNLAIEAGDVLAACAALGIERAIFIGTSRGGLILHLIAATRPDLLEAVILNDIGPVLEAEGLARIRDYLNGGRKAGGLERGGRYIEGKSWRVVCRACRGRLARDGACPLSRYRWTAGRRLRPGDRRGTEIDRFQPVVA